MISGPHLIYSCDGPDCKEEAPTKYESATIPQLPTGWMEARTSASPGEDTAKHFHSNQCAMNYYKEVIKASTSGSGA